MASLTAWFLWAERLSMTTMASGFCSRRPGSKVVWRKSRKTGIVVPVVTVVIVTTPSRPRAPRTVRRFQLTGASPHARSPIGARAVRRVMFVKIPLSSRKTNRFGSTAAMSLLKSSRSAARSGLCCSLARRVFFDHQAVALQRPANTGFTDLFAGLGNKGLGVFRQGGIVLRRDQRAQYRAIILI